MPLTNGVETIEGKDARQRGMSAMRLGLSKAPLDYADITYFR